MPRVSVVVPIYNVETYLERLPRVARRPDVHRPRGRDGQRRLDRSQPGDRRGVRGPRPALHARPPGERRPERGAQHGDRRGHGRVPGLRRQRRPGRRPPPTSCWSARWTRAARTSPAATSTGSAAPAARQARFLARTFAETRLKHAHHARPPAAARSHGLEQALAADSFWDSEGRRFPEGRIYEDTPVTLPLHFAASSVDVLSDVVYYWRAREGADLSITQRRTELRSLHDRLTAIRGGQRVPAPRTGSSARSAGTTRASWPTTSSTTSTCSTRPTTSSARCSSTGQPLPGGGQLPRLRPSAGQRAAASGISCGGGCCRSCWRSCASSARTRPRPRRCGCAGTGTSTIPFAPTGSLKIRRSLFRVDRELRFSTGLDVLDWEDGKLRIEGWAYVDGIGAPEKRSQRVTLTALSGRAACGA